MSSNVLKDPCSFLYVMILLAIVVPIPGIEVSSSNEALLIDILFIDSTFSVVCLGMMIVKPSLTFDAN